GLSRHENAKHGNYNIPPIQCYILPENTITEWKEMLVHAIHKQLPLTFRKTGKQVIKFPYMEGQYLELFRQYLTCVFVHKKAYRCVFSGSDAYQTISSLLGDQCWS
ncbi:31380_t:CDS:1, partial [Racocetra persica]